MTWITKGKIGCHFPERTGLNPNFDVTRVVYSQDGVVANAKEIEQAENMQLVEYKENIFKRILGFFKKMFGKV